MAQLAIKGHKTRGKEVIALLEMLGGKNEHHLAGCEPGDYYHIIKDGVISNGYVYPEGFAIFTLEEFEKEFPYKVGDKVLFYQTYAVINEMKWTGVTIEYVIERKKELQTTTAFYLEPYKEETMEKEISGAIIDRFICLEGFEFYDDKGNIINTKEIIMKKTPKYPKTFEDCLKILGYNIAHTIPMNHGHNGLLMMKFQRLLICRDAYWKFAGDWSFKIGGNSQETVYTITIWGTGILKDFYHALNCNRILVFPTEEMRDTFYENFKDLINECKELL